MMRLHEAEDLILAGNPLLARDLLDTVLGEEPCNPAALHLSGLGSIAAQDLDEGIKRLRSAVALSHDPSWLRDLGTAYLAANRMSDAVTWLQEAYRVDPANYEGRILLAEALTGCGRPRDAIALIENHEHSEGNSRALRVLGEAAFAAEMREVAARHFENACKIDPDSSFLQQWCAVLALSLSRFDAAVSHWRQCVKLKPDDCDAMCGFAIALWCAGEMEECRKVSRLARERFPTSDRAHVNWLRAIDHTSFDPAESRDAWEQWATLSKSSTESIERLERDWELNRVLRVGYLVDEIHKRPNAYFIPPLLENHDRECFHVVCYLTAPEVSDEMSELRRIGHTVRDVRSLSTEHIAQQVRADGVDILVNVSWEFRNRNLAVFGHRAAPIQIELPHYPATTGHPGTDFILSDRWICPPGREEMYSERVCRLTDSYMPWVLPKHAPDVTALPCLARKCCTFGLFQKPSKLNPLVWDAIAEVLHRVPSARLLIHNNSGDMDHADSGLRQRYGQELRGRQIDPERVCYMGVREYEEHFLAIAECDIALDTFPYNGTTTTGDCLWMGVPVVTLACGTHAGRVGYSMLSRLGLEELAASTTEEYVDITVRLAGDTARLDALRGSLRARMQKSVLTDARAVMSGIEREFRTIWRALCQTQSRQ